MLNLHNYFVKCDFLSEEMVLIAEKNQGVKKTMTLLCCWRKQAKQVEEEQLRESKMGLKPKPLKTVG